MKRILIAFALFLAMPVAALAQATPATEALKAQLEDALRTIRELQARVTALEQQKAGAPAAPAAAAPASPAAPTMASPGAAERAVYIPPQTLKDNESSGIRVDNALIDPALKGYFRIPGSDTMMKIGGYAKVDFIYDTKPIGTFDYFVTSAIPTSGVDTQRGSQFTVQAKQTRMNLDMRRDTEVGAARLYVEADWFGDASYAFSPGGYQFRLRHAFGQVGNVAAGYSFSAFMDNDALPDTLDFEGPGSAPYITLAGARYTWKLGKNGSLALSAEAPDAQVTAATGASRNTVPDFSLKGRYDTDAGHVQLSGVLRRIGYRDANGSSDTVPGYGLNLAGSYKTGIGDDYLVAGGVVGKGIARYVSDITGLGLDAVVAPSGNLEALNAYGGYAAYTHYWTSKLRSTGVVNYLGMSNKSYQAGTSFDNSQYYSANLIWNPWGALNVGAEVLYGRYKTLDGFSANDTRFQMSVQYDFVR